MHPTSQEEEIFNFVSKKLATASLSRRRSHTLTHHSNSTIPRISRVEKPSSRHASPKMYEKRSANPVPKYLPATESTFLHGTGVTAPSRPAISNMHRPERPYSWHPTSQSSQDSSYFPYPNQFITAPLEYSTAWQSSSYAWPGESQYANQRPSYELTGLAPTVQQVGHFDTSKPLPNGNDTTFGAYPAWYMQNADHGNIPIYPPGALLNVQDIMQSSSTFSTARDILHEESNIDDHNGGNLLQNIFQMAPPPAQHETDLLVFQGKPSQEEELVGLGLYDREEDVSPLQLCSGLSTSAPTHLGRQPAGKGLKLEETWQPPPEWQPSESTEGSEASASPYQEAQRYSSFEHDHGSFNTIPQQYPLDFGSTGFLFEVEDEWFTGNLKATPASNMGFAGYDWFGTNAEHVPY